MKRLQLTHEKINTIVSLYFNTMFQKNFRATQYAQIRTHQIKNFIADISTNNVAQQNMHLYYAFLNGMC